MLNTSDEQHTLSQPTMLLGLTPLLLASMSANGWRTAQLRLPSNAWYNRQHMQLSFSHSLMIHAILLGPLLVMRMWPLPLGAKLGGEPHINGSPGPRGCLLGACYMLPSHVVELQLCFFRLGIQLSLTRDAATLAAPHCHWGLWKHSITSSSSVPHVIGL